MTYLRQFRLTVHHIPGIKNELSDYIWRNNFNALIGESSEALAKEAFQRMDVQLDLSMRTAGNLEGWSLTDYQSEYKEILQTLSTGLEPRVIDGHQWYKNNQYLFYEDRIVVPEARLDGCLQWSHLSSGHTGANCSVDFFREWFYSSLTLTELRSRMQTIVDACGCHTSKQSDNRDRGLISSLPIPYCANSLLYVDFIHGLPRFGGYDSCLVVTCGLSRFTRVFPCNRKITGEQTVNMLVEQWFEPYGAPKQVHSDEDVRIRSDTGWNKQVLNALNVEVTTGVPYTQRPNPLCERHKREVEQNLRILMKQERIKDWVRLLPWAVLTMNSQWSSCTGFTPNELFHGGQPAWFFKTPFPEDFKSPVGDWLEHKQSMANQAGEGRVVAGGRGPNSGRPTPRQEAPPPGHPHAAPTAPKASSQERAIGSVTGPHARTPRTHSQWVVGPGRTPERTSGWGWGSARPRTPHTQARGAPPGHPHAAPTARKASSQERALWGWSRVPTPAPPAPTATR